MAVNESENDDVTIYYTLFVGEQRLYAKTHKHAHTHTTIVTPLRIQCVLRFALKRIRNICGPCKADDTEAADENNGNNVKRTACVRLCTIWNVAVCCVSCSL